MTGKVKAYTQPYSFNFGLPSAEADIIASVNADGTYPTLFVYDKGKKLSDGTVAPNKRITLFLGQTGTGKVLDDGVTRSPEANFPTDFTILSADGKKLLLNTLQYAVPVAIANPTVSIARAGSSVTISYAGGALQSAVAIGGPWGAEPGASPLTVTTTGAAKFYRVKAN